MESLKDLIRSGKKEIVLESDILLDECIDIDADGLVIDGQGHTIDAGGNSRIFTVAGKSITLKNINFKNGSESGGGAIFNEMESSLTLEGCSFIANHSKTLGGAIANDGSLNCVDCSFRDNSADFTGGAIHNQFYSTLSCVDCSFEGNNCQWGNDGGAIANAGSSVSLNRCSFIANHSGKYGAIYHHRNILDIKDCYFKDNGPIDIYNRSFINIYNSDFVGDPSNSYIIHQRDDEDSSLNVENSTFTSKGGIINIEVGFASINHSKFDFSPHDFAIRNENGELSVSGSKFSGKNAIFNNNLITVDEKDLMSMIEEGENSPPAKLKFMELPKNHRGFSCLDELIHGKSNEIFLEFDISMHESEKKFYEGGIEIDRNDLTIDGQNHIIDANGLSRIFLISANNVTLRNIIFRGGMHFINKLFDNAGGGAIYALANMTLTIENCQFIGNESKQKAGSIFNKSRLTLRNVKFIENLSKWEGGAIYNIGPVNLDGCSFNGNTAYISYGGAIYNLGQVSFDGCSFNGNTSIMGGAIYNKWGLLSCISCSFEGNSSIGGGAVFNAAYSNLNFSGCSFKSNSSDSNGGSIFNDKKAFLSCSDCNFVRNTLKEGDGFAIYNKGLSSCSRCCFYGNHTAENDGNAIITDKESLKIEKCKFGPSDSFDTLQ